MYKLKLNSKECISCGICMDVCVPRAIDMRIYKGNTLEGNNLSYYASNIIFKNEITEKIMMSFPFMLSSDLCNGCLLCGNECPTSAIIIESL